MRGATWAEIDLDAGLWSLPDKVEAVYRRGDPIDKRVQLMKAWADYCAKPATETTAAVVTPIQRNRSAK